MPKKHLCLLALSIVFSQAACTTPVATPSVRIALDEQRNALGSNWTAIIGQDQTLDFSGEIRQSGAGQGYSVVYPAVDIISFVGTIAAHSAIAKSRLNAAQSQRQIEADKVLGPYQASINELTTNRLLVPAIQANAPGARIAASAQPESTHQQQVQIAIRVTLLQDQRAMYLDLIGQQTGLDNGFRHAVRIVSDPLIETEPQAIKDHWLANDGLAFRETITSMLDRGVGLLIADIEGRLDRHSNTQTTIRYPLGGTRSAERVSIITRECARQTVRNLRQWVLSVPLETPVMSDASCDKPASA